MHYLKQVAHQYWQNENSEVDLSTVNTKTAQAAGQAAGILGQMYWRGEGVEQNNRTAAKWFSRGVQVVRFIFYYLSFIIHLLYSCHYIYYTCIFLG